MKPRVAVLFDTIGPYHAARLGASARLLDIVPIEARRKSRLYEWDFAGSSRFVLSESDGPVTWYGAMKVLHREVAQLRLDAIAVPGWSSMAALASLAWALRMRLPAVVMSDTNAHDFRRSPSSEFVKRRIVETFSAGLTGSDEQRAYLASLGLDPKAIFTGYDVVDNAYFRVGARRALEDADAEPLRLGLPARRFFLTTARMVTKKNLLALVEAYARYVGSIERDAVWPLVILGDGPERDALTRRSEALGLVDLVHMPGFRQYAALPEWYGLAGCFVLPSLREQWGLVVNEAMAAGLPVLVAKQCGCAASLVEEGGNGWTFDANTIPEIGDALLRMSRLSASERDGMAERSDAIIAAYGVERFGEGLARAVEYAMRSDARATSVLSRSCIRIAASVQEARSVRGIE